MTGNYLRQEPLNAVIVGNGAIGTALAENLLKRVEVRKVAILQRRKDPPSNDPRVSTIGFDAEQPETVAAAAVTVRESLPRIHLMINTVGMLHGKQQQPEKRLSSLEPEQLQRSFTINASLLPILVQSFGGLLRHDQPAIFASLSARVGSIAGNNLGGWYSYRASKAAHNMLLRTIAQEWRVTHSNAAIVALHPGTVLSPLSGPFITSRYKNPVHTPDECASSLLHVLGNLTPACSGRFYDWQGKTISW